MFLGAFLCVSGRAHCEEFAASVIAVLDEDTVENLCEPPKDIKN
jgi:hypothetical protein